MHAPSMPSTAATSNRRIFVRRVVLTHVVIGLLAFGVALFTGSQPVWIGVGMGALVATANFQAMAGLLERLTMGDMQTRSLAVGLLMVKLLVLGGAIVAILSLLAPSPIAFVVGLSVTPLSLLLVSAFLRPTDASPNLSSNLSSNP